MITCILVAIGIGIDMLALLLNSTFLRHCCENTDIWTILVSIWVGLIVFSPGSDLLLILLMLLVKAY